MELEREHKQKPADNISQETRKKKAEINEIYADKIWKKMMFTKQRYYERLQIQNAADKKKTIFIVGILRTKQYVLN